MSRHEKALARLKGVPTPADIKWDELKRVLDHLGYTEITNSGSRRKFYHQGKNALICCHKPHPGPNVDKGCIRDIVEHLRQYKFI